MKCTRVAGRVFPHGKSLGRNRVISSVLKFKIQHPDGLNSRT
jgi:hypothetical protein